MKKAYIILFALTFMLFSQTHGQTTLNLGYAQSWGTPLSTGGGDDYGKAIAVDASENSYVAGYTSSSIDLDPGASTFWTGGACFFLVKYTSAGSFVWAKILASTITPNAIVLDASNNIYITGSFTGISDFNPMGGSPLTAIGGVDVFFAKYDANGNWVFAKDIGGSSDENSKAIVLDASLNIYITGQFGGTCDFDIDHPGTHTYTATGTYDAFFAKYDASGNYVWAHSIGDTGDDCGYSIALDASSNVYITGNFYGINVDFGSGNTLSSYYYDYIDPDLGQLTGYWYSTYLAKYTSAGVYVWADMIGGDKSGDPNVMDPGYFNVFLPHSIKVDNSSNVYLMGAFQNNFTIGITTLSIQGSPYTYNTYFAKYDVSGNFIFAKEIQGTYYWATDFIVPGQMILDPSGNIIITGSLAGEADFDLDNVGTHVLSSGFESTHPADFFMAKYSSTGTYIWAFNWGTWTSTNIGKGLATDPSGNIYVTGAIVSGTLAADVDPGTGTQNLTSKVASSLFVAKYAPANTYSWAFTSDEGDGGDDTPGKIAMDALGNTYMVGTFKGTIDFDKSAAVNSLQTSSYSYTDIVFAKYDTHGNYLWAKKIGGSLNDKGLAIAIDASGNVYIAGNFAAVVDFDPDPVSSYTLSGFSSTSFLDMFLAKYDGNGNFLWANDFPAKNRLSVNPTSLAIDVSNNVFLGGYLQNVSNPLASLTIDMNPGVPVNNLTFSNGFKGFLAKYDASGNYSWAKLLNSTSTGSSRLKGIATDISGNSYVTGIFAGLVDFDPGSTPTYTLTTGSTLVTNIFIANYSSVGACAWAKQIAASNSNGIATDASSNIYITGNYSAGSIDFDPAGGGHTLTASGTNDIFFAKYNSSGTYLMAKSLPGTSGTSTGQGFSIAVDAASEIALTGVFSETVNFDPGGGSQNLISNGSDDIFIAKYDVNGAYVVAKNIGGTAAETGVSIAFNAGGDSVCVLGSIPIASGAIDFDPEPTVSQTLTSLSGTDMFLAKYSVGVSVLPIELLEFKATLKNNQVELYWSTASEINNDVFTIEKTITGKDYEILGKVRGAGNSSIKLEYSLIDSNPFIGTAYYRLKQTDFDGKFEYSYLVAVQYSLENDNFISAYPNPVERKLFIQFNEDISVDTKFNLKDISGKDLNDKYVLSNQNNRLLAIEFDKTLAPGVYFITATNNYNVFTKKIIIH